MTANGRLEAGHALRRGTSSVQTPASNYSMWLELREMRTSTSTLLFGWWGYRPGHMTPTGLHVRVLIGRCGLTHGKRRWR